MTDPTMLVTGGTSGIGRALVDLGVRAGFRVFTCGRDRDRLQAIRDRHPDVVALETDLSTAEGVASLAAELLGELDALDVLVNNAAFQTSHLLDGTGGPDARAELSTNLSAPIDLTLRLLPLLDQASEATIVMVTSILGLVPQGRAPVYSAAKAGLHGFTTALRQAVSDRGINVIEALPPLTDTPMAASLTMDKVSPDAFARVVLDAVERRDRSCGIGDNLAVLDAHQAMLELTDRFVG